LVEGGETACPGVATGAACHLAEDDDLDAFPAGGVAVARRSSPRYVRVMDRAAAIVSDAGSLTGHMACLARELGIPTVLNLRRATSAIPPGTVVTVDADAGLVYRGEVPLDRGTEGSDRTSRAAAPPPPETAASRLLRAAAPLVIPLHLTDPRHPDFSPPGCRTLHDVARYVHEKSYAEMFHQGEDLGDLRSASARLDVFVPIDLYVVDLGGAVLASSRSRTLKPESVVSVPLGALLRGILDPRLPRFGPRPIDLGGLVSVMMRHALSSPEQERTFRDPCYALASDVYLNYAARVGYHFGVVDTFCSETANRNYISFRFTGGAADPLRRGRRARSIATVLRESGFTVTATGDAVQARLTKASQGETMSHLETLGRLLQFYRQMDAAMADDDSAELFARAFLEGDFKLERVGRG
jgi:pyruvate,water dikinase